MVGELRKLTFFCPTYGPGMCWRILNWGLWSRLERCKPFYILLGPAHHIVEFKNRVNVILGVFVDAVLNFLTVWGAHLCLVTTLPDAFLEALQRLSCCVISKIVGQRAPIIDNDCVQNEQHSLVISHTIRPVWSKASSYSSTFSLVCSYSDESWISILIDDGEQPSGLTGDEFDPPLAVFIILLSESD